MKFSNNILIFIVILFAFIISCGKEEMPCEDQTNPKCPNYNPCLTFKEANADFIIYDSLRHGVCLYTDEMQELNSVYEIEDSMYYNKELYFKAVHNNDSYTWKIGSDTSEWDKKKFSLFFGPNAEGEIPVTLVVEKVPPYSCRDSFSRHDTITKFFKLYAHGPNLENVPTLGRFKGVNISAPQDTFTIKTTSWPFTINNLICEGRFLEFSFTQKHMLFTGGGTNCDACGRGTLQEDGKTIIINYSFQPDSVRLQKTFIGKRIKG